MRTISKSISERFKYSSAVKHALGKLTSHKKNGEWASVSGVCSPGVVVWPIMKDQYGENVERMIYLGIQGDS